LYINFLNYYSVGSPYQVCQNRDFTSGRKGIAKLGLVKSQSKSKDFTQGLLYNRYKKL